MRSSLFTLAASASVALAARGFNYGSQGQTYESFLAQFQTAAGLVGADDFASARLYTMIQDGTANTVISAIPAAIASNTTLLLGLWASTNQAVFDNELTALRNAINQYGTAFTDLVVGISVGSEDLYRVSPTGIAANSGYGQTPDVLVDYIRQTRDLIRGTGLGSKPVGHVDTWNDFVNGTNSAVIAAADFLGLDEYPYYQTTDANSIDNAHDLFFEAYDRVAAVAGGKPIWITETGWPVSGASAGDAVPSVANAGRYWQEVACELIRRNINTWWYILSQPDQTPNFDVTNAVGNTTPLYNLACSSSSSSSSSSAGSSSTRSASSVAQPTSPTSAAASTTVRIGNPVPSGTGASGNASTLEPTVYVTAVTTSYVTTCPVGYTLTQSGSTTVLQTPSVITTTTVVPSTVSTSVMVPATAPLVTGTAASGSGFLPGQTGASTLASTWAAGQTPSGAATYTGAASKVGGSMAALALGAVVAFLAL